MASRRRFYARDFQPGDLMPLWEIHAKQWSGQNFLQVAPEEIFAEFGQLLTFTFRDSFGNLSLAHLCASDLDRARYAVAPTDRRIVRELLSGAISVRDALDQPWTWVVDVGANGSVLSSWAIRITDFPPDALPDPEVLLYPELEPMIRLRATGDRVRVGAIPAATIRKIVDGVEYAYKGIRKAIGPVGAPMWRDANVLDAQQLRFGSVEIAFRPTSANVQENQKIEQVLARALKWAFFPDFRLSDDNPRENRAILEAVKWMSPGRGERATRIEVTGRVAELALDASPGRVLLTRKTWKRAHLQLRRLAIRDPEPEKLSVVGRIRQVDEDFPAFTLREREDRGVDVSFTFDLEEYMDDVHDAQLGGYRVLVTGERSPGEELFVLRRMKPVHQEENDDSLGITDIDDDEDDDDDEDIT